MDTSNLCESRFLLRSCFRVSCSLIVVLSVLTAPPVFGFQLQTSFDKVAVDNVTVMKSDIIVRTNSVREKSALIALNADKALAVIAQRKSDLMAERGEFAHILTDGSTAWSLMKSYNYNFLHAGENLAVHFTTSREVVEAWIASPSHKANLLNANFTSVGVGVSQGVYKGSTGYFVVQLFATPFPSIN